MKRTLLPFLGLCLLFTACEEGVLTQEEVTPAVDSYFLSFEVSPVYYTGGEVDTSAVYALQTSVPELELLDASQLETFQYGYWHPQAGPDSITLLARLRFEQDAESDFDIEAYELDFYFTEALDQVEELGDGRYRHLNKALLTERINGSEWSGPFNGTDFFQQQFQLSFPGTDLSAHGWNEQSVRISSTVFYFDYEQLQLGEAVYHEETDQITLSGSFTVDLKILSCGFYQFYQVRNASFRVLIP